MNTEISTYGTEANLNTIFIKRTTVFNLFGKSNNYLLFFFYNNVWFFISPLNTFTQLLNNIFSNFFKKKTQSIFFTKQFKTHKLRSTNSKQRSYFYKHLLQIPTFFKKKTFKKFPISSKYTHHSIFITFYSKLFRSDNLRIVTPLLKANPYQFFPQSKTPFTEFFKSKNFCNVVNRHKRLKFLELLTNITKKIKIISLKEKQLTDFKNFSKLDFTNKQKNFNFLLPRQNVFLNTRKQLDFTACKPVSTMLLSQMLSIYKRGVKKNWINLNSSTSRQLTLQTFLKKTKSSRMVNLNIIPLFSKKNNKRGKLKRRLWTPLLVAVNTFADKKKLPIFKKSFKNYIKTRLNINKKQIIKHLKKIKKIKLLKLIKKLKKYGVTKKLKKLYKVYKMQKIQKLQKNQRRGHFEKKRKWSKYYKSKKSRFILSLRKNKKSYRKFYRTTVRRVGIRTNKRLQALSFQKLSLTFRHSLAPIGSITNKWLYLGFKLHLSNSQKTRFKRLNFLKKKNIKRRVKRRRYKKSKPAESKKIRTKTFIPINKNNLKTAGKYKTGFNSLKLKTSKKTNKHRVKSNLKSASSQKNKFIYFNFKISRLHWSRRRTKYINKRREGTRLLISKRSLINRRWFLKNTNQTSFLRHKRSLIRPLQQKSSYFWVASNTPCRDLSPLKVTKSIKKSFSDDANFSMVLKSNYDNDEPLYPSVRYAEYIHDCWEDRFLEILHIFERHLRRSFNRNDKSELTPDEAKFFRKEVRRFMADRRWLDSKYKDIYYNILGILNESDQYIATIINFRNNLSRLRIAKKFNLEIEEDENWPFLGIQNNRSLPNYRGWKKTKHYIIKTDTTFSKKKEGTFKKHRLNVVSTLYNAFSQKIMSAVLRKDTHFKVHKLIDYSPLNNSLSKCMNDFRLSPFYLNILISRKSFITSYRFITFDLNPLFNHALKKYTFLSPHLKPISKSVRSPSVPKDYHLFSKYNRSFISLSTGFLFTNCNFLYHKRFKLDSLKVSHMNRQRYSFFYKNDIKRFYLNRSSNLTFLQNLDPNNFLRNNFLYDRLYLRKNHHSYNSLNSIFTNSIANTSIDAFFLKYRGYRKAINLWGHEQFFYTHQTVTSQLWEPRIKRIRFKPGYQRIWRKAREGINFSLKFNLRYQHRLTHKLAKLRFIKHKCTSRIHDLTLLKIILNTRFVYDLNVSKSLISNSLVYVNGIIVSNPQLLLYVGDFIQLVISLKYYIVYRWLVSWNFTQRARLVKLAFYKSKAKHDLAKQKSRVLPDWIFNVGSRQLDIPKYTEVDYFTLSIFIIYEPLSVNEFNPLLFLDDRSYILNMYNWKFIN